RGRDRSRRGDRPRRPGSHRHCHAQDPGRPGAVPSRMPEAPEPLQLAGGVRGAAVGVRAPEMTSIPRPSLEQAAQTWLAQTDASMDDPKLRRLRAALEDFLAKRFHGAAADLRAVHDLRNSLLDDGRSIESHVAEGAQSWDRSSLGKAASDSAPPELGRLLFSLVWN